MSVRKGRKVSGSANCLAKSCSEQYLSEDAVVQVD